MIWSTQTARSSRMDYVRDQGVAASRTLPFKGLEAALAEAPFRHGTNAWMVANGSVSYDGTHLLRYSQESCAVQGFEVDEPAIWGVVADEQAFYTTNAIDGAAHVRRRTMDGEIAAEALVPETLLSGLASGGDRLYAVGPLGEAETERTVVITFDAATFEELDRIELGDSRTPVSALVHEGTLYLPAGATSDPDGSGQEVSTVDMVDVDTGEAGQVDLGAASPYIVAGAEGWLVCTHTFMNAPFRDMDAYGQVTVLDAATGEASTVDVGPGLRQISVVGDELLVLTQQGEGDARLTRYVLADMSELSSAQIPVPEGGEHYLSGVIAHLPGS
ncbi:hypothetical protein M3F63_13250 [Brachybacterium muris]|uniref:hypothetical protein n=2 Tax=Brachybacterium muris TaxID=219301 RepID=UPI00223B08A4|nr:hypothetical protein [Brachybacterium muris]MCT2178610.1 hypothetical protein [Brachybacterium muris]